MAVSRPNKSQEVVRVYWTRLSGGWDPFDEIRRLQREMNKVFDGASSPDLAEFPPVNVWTGPDDYVLTAQMPGLDKNDLDLTVTGDTLTIKGARSPEKLGDGEVYHRRERGWGQFVRSFKLPSNVDGNRVDARYSRGVLRVTLPRAEAYKPRKISLRPAQ
jgi:HSP20 family protein